MKPDVIEEQVDEVFVPPECDAVLPADARLGAGVAMTSGGIGFGIGVMTGGGPASAVATAAVMAESDWLTVADVAAAVPPTTKYRTTSIVPGIGRPLASPMKARIKCVPDLNG